MFTMPQSISRTVRFEDVVNGHELAPPSRVVKPALDSNRNAPDRLIGRETPLTFDAHCFPVYSYKAFCARPG